MNPLKRKHERNLICMNESKINSMLVKKIRKGKFQAVKIALEKSDYQQISAVLRNDEYTLFPSVINYLEWDAFKSLVGFLSKEDLRRMAFAQESLAFRTMTTSACFEEMSGKENLNDYSEKTKFFLELDKIYFKQLFYSNNFISKCSKVKNTFECLLKEMDIKETKFLENLDEKLPIKKTKTEGFKGESELLETMEEAKKN